MKEEISTNRAITMFEHKAIRRTWHNERWYFAVTDIIAILTGSVDSLAYWRKLKERLKQEGNESVTNCHGLKMVAQDGKMRVTDTGDLETVFRLIQSVPSPKAEPLKLWLARVGVERIKEIQDPELAVNRAKEIYERKGYSKGWIEKRLRGIHVRNTLTDEWKERGVKASNEFAILTDEIYKGTFDMNAQEYKDYKSLDKENNLRDHMNDIELILTMLGEATTTNISQGRDSRGMNELHRDAKDGGAVAGRTRKDIDRQSSKKAISKDNFLSVNRALK